MSELAQKILQIIKTHANPKQGISNLKQNQNIVPGLVAIIKASAGKNIKKVINAAPANDVANALTRVIRNGVAPKAAAQVISQVSADVIAKALTSLIKNGVKIPGPVAAAAIPTLVPTEPEAAVSVINNTNASVVAKALTEIIKKGVAIPGPVAAAAIPTLVEGNKPGAAVAVIKQTNASAIANALTEIIKKGVKIPGPVAAAAIPTLVPTEPTAAVAVIKQTNASVVANTIADMIKRGVTIPPSVAEAAATVVGPNRSIWSSLKKMFFPSSKMPVEGQPNFIEAEKNGNGKFKPPPPGYVLTTRVNSNGILRTGFFKNKPPTGPEFGPALPPPARNYTKMSIRELLKALRDYPSNKPTILVALRKAVEHEIRDAKDEYSRSRRARKLGDLLRLLPRNYNGRRNVSSMVVDDVRDTRNNRELSNLRSNLGSVPNENIRRALNEQRKRFGRSKGGPPLNYGSGGGGNENELRRRRALLIRMSGGGGGNGGGGGGGNGGGGGGGNGGGGGGGNGGGAPPPLPPTQQRAINNAGGVNRAMNTIVKTPGGANEVAKAAEALNETNGNTVHAIQIKGASPEAVKAVQNLGGPKNTMVVLEGLNTLSRKTAKKAKGPRRKPLRPRVAELNRVLESVKKQRLISLMAHNVTKTHNIHPNDEKLKKYYKKVLKANILRTPFAKIVKGSAKKKRVVSALKSKRA
jgi:RIO-like serine/threonine protein kinase